MTSRQKLYEFGEPLGNGATRAKLGGGYVCGGGGDSDSTQQSNSYDNRVAVQDGIGLSASNGNWIDASSRTHYEATTNYSSNTKTDINVTDGGLVGRGLDSVDKAVSGALDSVNMSNATNSDNFTKLLDTAGDWFNKSQGLIGQTQKSVADAYAQAQTESKGTIDNKTIMVIAVVAVAGLAFVNKAK